MYCRILRRIWGQIFFCRFRVSDTPLPLPYPKRFSNLGANQKAKLIILFSVLDEVQPHIREATTSKESWDKLKIVSESKNKNTILYLQSQLLNLKMQPTEKVEMFLRRVATLRASLQALEEDVTDTLLMPIVLRALPPHRIFVTTLNITDQTTTFEELVNMLQQEEAIHSTTETEQQTLASNQKGKKQAKSSKQPQKQGNTQQGQKDQQNVLFVVEKDMS